MRRTVIKQLVIFPKKRRCRASMTVELTLLMPLLIGVFLFLFFTLYYLHDVSALQKGCATALIRGSLVRDVKEAKIQMETALLEIRLLGKWDLATEVDVRSDLAEVKVSGKMKAREGLFLKLISKDYEFSTDQSTARIDETAYILRHGR